MQRVLCAGSASRVSIQDSIRSRLETSEVQKDARLRRKSGSWHNFKLEIEKLQFKVPISSAGYCSSRYCRITRLVGEFCSWKINFSFNFLSKNSPVNNSTFSHTASCKKFLASDGSHFLRATGRLVDHSAAVTTLKCVKR